MERQAFTLVLVCASIIVASPLVSPSAMAEGLCANPLDLSILLDDEGLSKASQARTNHYRNIVRREPDNPYAWYLLGLQLQKTGKLPQAQLCYELAIKVNANLPSQNQMDHTYLTSFLNVQNLRSHLALHQGYEAEKAGNRSDAIRKYRQSLDILDRPLSWWYLAVALHKEGKLDEALNAFEHATGERKVPDLSISIQLKDGAKVEQHGGKIKITYPKDSDTKSNLPSDS